MDHNTSGTNWGNKRKWNYFHNELIHSLESLSGGSNGSTITDGQLKTVYEKFEDSEMS